MFEKDSIIADGQINEKDSSITDVVGDSSASSNEPEFTKEELEYLRREDLPQRWYQWFSPTDTKEEKVLILKLDLIVWLYLFLSSFVKTLDSTAIQYSYVSGMKEDLKMFGNQLTYQGSCYMAGFIFGQIPLTMLATKLPINYYLPLMDTVWSFFILGMFKIQNYHQLYALRFCIGLFGSFYFPVANWYLGCWYRKSELTKRSALYFVASQVGSMCGGYIQAGAYTHLDGRFGLAGWRWLYIIAFVLTVPVCLYGIVVLPNLPNTCRSPLLTKREVRLSQLRMIKEGRSADDKLNFAVIKKTVIGWKFPMLVLFAVFFSQADGISSNSALPIWLKENNYSISLVNTITTIIPAITIASSLLNGIIVDTWNTLHPYCIGVTAVINIIAGIILVVWTVSHSSILAAFFMSGTADGIAAVLYSWANIICSENSAERALTLSTMNTLGNTFSVWVPIFVWRTEDAPRYRKGNAYNIALDAMMLVMLVPLTYLWRRDQRLKKSAAQENSEVAKFTFD